MKAQHMLVAILAAGFISVAGMAAAQGPGGWHHGGGEGMEFLAGLNLTDAQKDQAHKIEHAAWAQAKPLMQQAHALHEQIVTQLLTAGTTAEQIQPLVAQEEQIRTQMDNARLTTALQLRALLTPEQLAKAATTHQQLEALHEQEHQVMENAHDGEN